MRVVSAHVHEYEYLLAEGMTPIVDDGADVARNAVLAVPKAQADDLLARKAKSKTNTISKRALAKVAGIGVTSEADGLLNCTRGRIVVRSEDRDRQRVPPCRWLPSCVCRAVNSSARAINSPKGR